MVPGGYRILRLCSDLGPSEGYDDPTQISFPSLLPGKDPLRFALLRAWLERCNKDHHCKRRDDKRKRLLPTRLLYVGDPDDSNYDPDVLRLVPGEKIQAKEYVALSHCWGNLTNDQKKDFWTTKDNYSVREKEFSIDKRLKTIHDAIEVTRELCVQYLWIDSFCIMQGEGGDWEQESQRMEDVYSLAYCTIAATSAIDSNAGFLERSSESVCVQDGSGRRLYVCPMADFDEEVERALLNSRAWVMQERLLSCRTIHFGAKQMYWECGKGVYCEDLTRLTSSYGKKKYFKLDPGFPRLLYDSGFAATIYFLQSLIEDYSKRGLSEPTDRAVALSGLAARIARALRYEERYGIFSYCLHRNVLWQRSDQQKKMKRIEYKDTKVPSWSWMAYEGGIKFTEDRFGYLDLFKDLKFAQGDKGTLITKVWTFQGCQLKREPESEAGRHQILDVCGAERGWIVYDVEDGAELGQERGVVVGRTNPSDRSDGPEYHILVVRQRAENEYERVGIGRVQHGHISRQEADVFVV